MNSEQVGDGCLKMLLWLPIVFITAFPIALVVWLMSWVLPFELPGMGYWQWYAAVVIAHCLFGRS